MLRMSCWCPCPNQTHGVARGCALSANIVRELLHFWVRFPVVSGQLCNLTLDDACSEAHSIPFHTQCKLNIDIDLNRAPHLQSNQLFLLSNGMGIAAISM